MPFCSHKTGVSVVGVWLFFSPSVISWLIPIQAIMLKEIISVILQGLFFIFRVLRASVTQKIHSSPSQL